jgi:hypothetical protein
MKKMKEHLMKRTHICNTLIGVSFLSAMCFGMPAAASGNDSAAKADDSPSTTVSSSVRSVANAVSK